MPGGADQAAPHPAPGPAAAGLAVESNPGQAIQNTGPGTMHAPFQVAGSYYAAPVTQILPATEVSWPVRVGRRVA